MNDRVLFPALIVASLGAHVVFASRLAGIKDAPIHAPVVVEMDLAETPPPPTPPPPPPPAPTPAPTHVDPSPTQAPAAARPHDTVARAPSAKSDDTPRATNDAPLDFTGTTLSNDTGGWSIGGGGSGTGAGPGPAAPAARPAPAAPSGPRYVAAGELSRAPRAPGLNGELERNYPAEARRSGVAGTAVIRISILPDGRVGSIRRVSESYPGFGEACERTVRGSRWSPPLDARGEPVATEVNYTCRFEIKG